VAAVHQILASARLGDAVTQFALALRSAFGSDRSSTMLAGSFDDTVAGEFRSLDAGSVPDGDLVLYHLSIGCPPAVEWLRRRAETASGPYGIVYHNVTPPQFFEGLSWEHAHLAEQGREDLAALVPGAVVVVAVSEHNAAEIEALGGRVDAVHPPITTTRRLADLQDDRRLARSLRRAEAPAFVHVGQRLPHKRAHHLVVALHLLTAHLGTDAELTLVGAAPVPAYDRVVEGLARDLAPGRCRSTGLVPDREVATRIRHADALVTLSRHEGFYVPAVEAMAVGTPVLACDAGAVAETTGGAALLLPPDPRPTLVAEALHALATDEVLREDLRRRGLRRAAEVEAAIDLEGLAGAVTRGC
jgi:L-malate glycosyltransferase